jgi:hypothetical protein
MVFILARPKAADRADFSDEGAGDGKVSEPLIKRGVVPSPSSLPGAKTGPLCSQWRDGAPLTRLTVAFTGSQIYAAERYRSRKWKFRVIKPTPIKFKGFRLKGGRDRQMLESEALT